MSADGKTNSSVRATREYILAAGAVHTPQVLQLSGIGPKSLLSSLGIETVVDLPVGYNFQDQPSIFTSWTCESNLSQNVENCLMLLRNQMGAIIHFLPQTG
jgi:choline dehydrogenase-like flavoprotein